jgi:hypothetical protein
MKIYVATEIKYTKLILDYIKAIIYFTSSTCPFK